jgi:Fibronectin type III domain
VPPKAAFVLLALAALGLPGPAVATTVVPVPDEALVADAALIAVVRIDSSAPVDGEAIETEVRAAVEEVLKGAAGSAELTLRLPGGLRADGEGLVVFGVPVLRPGERALLFLVPGRAGTWDVLHLALGAFHEMARGGNPLAVRDLTGVRSLGPAASAPEEPRDFERFRAWVADRAAGRRRAADYKVSGLAAPDGAAGDLARAVSEFTLLETTPKRWFRFDTGDRLTWKADIGGQPGVPGGGFAEFEAALAVWTADPGTPVRLALTARREPDSGTARKDEHNMILFEDPLDQIPGTFRCTGNGGGLLAVGGYFFHANNTATFKGTTYVKIGEGFIVTQDGSGCYFDESRNPSWAAEELFAHELGHTLGLGHSSENPNESNPVLREALMFFAPPDAAHRARLNSDDRAALRHLYALTPAGTPAAPADLTADVLSSTTVRLSWIRPATDIPEDDREWELRLQRRIDDGTFVDAGVFPAGSTEALIADLKPGATYRFRVLAVGRDGSRSAPANEARITLPAATPPCAPGPARLCLGHGRFAVEVFWWTKQGAAGPGRAAPLAGAAGDETGLFWFFDPSNIELVVKVLDGCALNARTWFFAGGLTDVRVRTTVIDTATGWVRDYTNLAGAPFAPLQDTAAFANCGGPQAGERGAGSPPVRRPWRPAAARTSAPAAAAAPAPPSELRAVALSSSAVRLDWLDNSREVEFRIERRSGSGPGSDPDSGGWTEVAHGPFAGALVNGLAPGTRYRFRVRAVGRDGGLSAWSEVAAATTWVSTPPCTPGPERLCLGGGRFAAEVAWSTAGESGRSGAGQAHGLTDDTGLFWYFDPANVEVVLKVHDGCAVNGHYWVFAGGLTDVVSLVRVTDTRTGAVQLYGTRQGIPFQPIQDTGAFACP